MFHSLTMQSTNGTEIWPKYPDLFMQLIRFGSVLWSPLYAFHLARNAILAFHLADPEIVAILWYF